MNLTDRFHDALHRASVARGSTTQATTSPASTSPASTRQGSTPLIRYEPSMLVSAAAEALNVAGAGIAIIQPLLRIPLAATNEHVRYAEQLQATLGDGPCLDAARRNSPVVADEHTMRNRWPLYHEGLISQTPFRSAAAVSLWNGTRVLGALNLYGTDTAMNHLPAMDRIRTHIAVPLAAILLGALTDLHQTPDWADHKRLNQRLQVWTAVGVIMQASRLDDHDALAVLRSFAYSHDLTLDAVSQQVVDRHLSLDAVTDQQA